MPVRKFRLLSAVIGMADPLSSPPGLAASIAGGSGPLTPQGGRFARRRRFDGAQPNRRIPPAVPFGRPRNALNQSRAARRQAAYPGLN